jgi:hypothetical protein
VNGFEVDLLKYIVGACLSFIGIYYINYESLLLVVLVYDWYTLEATQ